MSYAEIHCHSYYSFHNGASSIEELVLRARELGYAALALTDHDNRCGAAKGISKERTYCPTPP